MKILAGVALIVIAASAGAQTPVATALQALDAAIAHQQAHQASDAAAVNAAVQALSAAMVSAGPVAVPSGAVCGGLDLSCNSAIVGAL